MKLSIPLLCIALGISGSSFAQNANVGADASNRSTTSAGVDSSGASADEGTEMNATLSKPIDARHAKPGDEVTATLAQDAKGNGGTPMPRGTKLIGHVTEARPASGDSDSRLGIVFDRAVLKGGREVPVTATLQAIAQGEAAAAGGAHGADPGVGAGGFEAADAAAGGRGLTGSAGGALGGAARVGGVLGRTATLPVGSATRASGDAVGRAAAAGQLLAGSRGVFGMHGVDMVSGASGNASGSVLTSHTGNIHLERGTQMVLMSQAAGSASGSGGAGNAAAVAGASGAAATGASATRQR